MVLTLSLLHFLLDFSREILINFQDYVTKIKYLTGHKQFYILSKFFNVDYKLALNLCLFS